MTTKTKKKKNAKARALKRTAASKKQMTKQVAQQAGHSVNPKPTVGGGEVLPAMRWVLAGLGVVGVVLTLFLTQAAWTKAQLPLCGAESGCDVVQGSRWSTLLGLPVSLWGALFYAVVVLVAISKKLHTARRWLLLWLLSWAGLAVSVYLTAISLFVIQNTCTYCLASLGLALGIFVLTFAWGLLNGELGKASWLPRLGTGLGAALVVVLGLHLAYHSPWQSPPAAENQRLKALAQHLTKSGAVFYGASWCSACELQKGMFEGSAHRLPYVECSPAGQRGPRNPECTLRGVRSYPTWFFNNVPHKGVLSPEDLARKTGYVFPP